MNDRTQDLYNNILAGRTEALSKGITLVESSAESDVLDARELLQACLSHAGKSIRVAISGVPGVGKSTFINRFGLELISRGKKVAVLAIDPSSEKSSGSILGDKTRMAELATNDSAYIRPTPSAGALGGVARNTFDSMLLCEAAGYDVVIIETVGVGQSETAVARICDLFLLLVLAGSGDELQGIKRGIMEQADMIVVNRTDMLEPALVKTTAQDLKNAIHLFPANEKGLEVNVGTCSALNGDGIMEIADQVLKTLDEMAQSGKLQEFRNKNRVALTYQLLQQLLYERSLRGLGSEIREQVERDLLAGRTTPYEAVQELLKGIGST